MRLVRYDDGRQIRPGVMVEEDKVICCGAFTEDYDERFFESGGLERLRSWLGKNRDSCPQLQPSYRLAPPVVRPSKLLCIGLNYARHAAESGLKPPEEPVMFMKATTAISGPFDDLILPPGSVKTDWEVELAIVIGRRASYVRESAAMDYVAGYLLMNDVSEREFQIERGGQWVKGKSADTFAPLGPFMATREEIPDPQSLRLWLRLNGEMVQDSNTSDMIFSVPELIAYTSRFMTLLPGDILSTGTPEGVGMGRKPARYLKPGDVVEPGIQGLGQSRQVVRALGDQWAG